jgi:small subunit ribosomal protein S7
MRSGKKTIAQKIVYGAMDVLAEKNPGVNTLDILQRSIDNAKPRIETKARRVGGATYQVPMEIPAERQVALAMRWLTTYADARRNPDARGIGCGAYGRIHGAG